MGKMENEEIRYFSMFTGVGGFELGIGRANNHRLSGCEKQGRDENKGSQRWDSSGIERTNRGNKAFSCVERANDNQSKNEELQAKQTISSDNLNELQGTAFSFVPIGFSEIDKYASELLSKKFPTVKNYGDCTKIEAEELPDFDMLCGGFPCQSFSIAGKRKGFNDTRGTMFFEVTRILKIKRPKIVLLENVKGLLNHEKGKTFSVILETLDELGYESQWMVLNSKFFGVPQNRERVFIIGNLRGEPRPEILPFGESSKEDDGANEMIQINNPIFSSYRYYDKQGISPVVKTMQGGNLQPKFLDGMKIRRITPTECERLQGFPDGHTEGFSDTQRYKMMGNAVTVNVVKAIISKLFQSKAQQDFEERLDKSEKEFSMEKESDV